MVTLRRAALWSCLALSATACLEVSKLDPGPFVIDDFENGDASPRPASFAPWACRAVSTEISDGGAGGADPDAGASADIDGSTANCALERPGDDSCCALAMTFNLPPGAAGQHDNAQVSTDAMPNPVDFTRFRTFVFSGIVESSSSAGLPYGTQLIVELGCSKLQAPAFPSASQSVTFMQGRNWTASRLPMAAFIQRESSVNQDCLVKVDSIRFIVSPGRGPQLANGTLHIDNVYLLQ